MNTRTGDIFPSKQMLESLLPHKAHKRFAVEMKTKPTPQQLKRKPVDSRAMGRVGRNEACPCGSGKKFKYCHLNV
jgi:uncharacterized protein YecA (UPF0149 family)